MTESIHQTKDSQECLVLLQRSVIKKLRENNRKLREELEEVKELKRKFSKEDTIKEEIPTESVIYSRVRIIPLDLKKCRYNTNCKDTKCKLLHSDQINNVCWYSSMICRCVKNHPRVKCKNDGDCFNRNCTYCHSFDNPNLRI